MSARFKLIADHAGADDWYDAYGTGMMLAFDICTVLDAADIEGDVTPALFDRWQYRRGASVTVPSLETIAARAEDFIEGEWADDFTYGEVGLASALVSGDITVADLIYVGEVMHRYTSLLASAGRDY